MQDHLCHVLCLMILTYDIDGGSLELILSDDSEPIN
jgi:hypothetical protein